jgi:hypothetical protein
MMAVQDLEGYDEVVQRFLELIPPEKRLAGLAPEQVLLTLPDDLLRGFSEEVLARLPEPTRNAIRKRLGR